MNGPSARPLRTWMALAISSLPHAVLALDQDVGVALGDRLDQLEELAHLLALPDDVRERVLIAHLLLQALVLRAFDLQVGGAIEDRDNARGIEIRFFDEEERTGLAGFERARDGADAADHDHLRRFVDRLQLAQQARCRRCRAAPDRAAPRRGATREKSRRRASRPPRRAPRSPGTRSACSMTIFSQSVTIGSSSTTSTRRRFGDFADIVLQATPYTTVAY